MKGRIDNEGGLHIYRNGRDVAQFCPYQTGGHNYETCSHFCPQFGDPEESTLGGTILLEICQRRVLQFDTLIDERKIVTPDSQS